MGVVGLSPVEEKFNAVYRAALEEVGVPTAPPYGMRTGVTLLGYGPGETPPIEVVDLLYRAYCLASEAVHAEVLDREAWDQVRHRLNPR